jgi:hypothetical protein
MDIAPPVRGRFDMIDVTVKKTGPLFDGRAQAAVDRFTRNSTTVLTRVGKQMVKLKYRSRIRENTGHFLGRISGEVTGRIGHIYTKFILYGYWLEGVGSQNATSRFKGYWAYRETFIELDSRSQEILQPLVDKMIREMGGE